MSERLYSAAIKVRSPGGATMVVKAAVRASNYFIARMLLEAQYGQGSVIGTPTATDR